MTRTKNHAWLVQFCMASSVVIGVLVYPSQLAIVVYPMAVYLLTMAVYLLTMAVYLS